MKKGIIIAVLLLVVGAYFVGTAVTRNATGSIIENITERMAEESGYDVDIQWLDNGFFRGNLQVTATMQFDESELTFQEAMKLRYGFLRTRVTGEANILLDGESLSEQLFDGKITSKGLASMQGYSTEYRFPAISSEHFGRLLLSAPPFTVKMVFTDSAMHYELDSEGVTLTMPDSEEEIQVEGIRIASQSVLADNQLRQQQMEYRINSVVSTAADAAFSMQDSVLTSDFSVDQDVVNGTLMYELGSFQFGEVAGFAELGLRYEDFSFSALQAWGDSTNTNDTSAQSGALRLLMTQGEPVLHIDTFDLTIEEIGRTQMNGYLRFDRRGLNDEEVELLFGENSDDLIRHIRVHLKVEELPLLAMMTMMMITTDPLPWTFDFHDGELLLNNEVLNLSDFGLPQ
ncbi:DUF945 family protein [Aliidiomarina sanyensis]|uniref:DUF945 domain-containing protein n=1 Tax=Aliidiomarina sanyensis TaxID=1249555 RepID=A0A432WQ12_9GAMM|nr:DUF945 family protein [Aliidiomarina sanyensis]RUO35860.1 hypothetical protein CWE11_03670 [Aliidiomarina sanyensis]